MFKGRTFSKPFLLAPILVEPCLSHITVSFIYGMTLRVLVIYLPSAFITRWLSFLLRGTIFNTIEFLFFFSFDNMAFIVTVCLFIVFRFPPPWAYLLLVDCCHWHLFLLFEQAWHFVLLGGKDGHDGNWVYWDCSILICLSSWAYPGLAG